MKILYKIKKKQKKHFKWSSPKISVATLSDNYSLNKNLHETRLLIYDFNTNSLKFVVLCSETKHSSTVSAYLVNQFPLNNP